jgi:RNA polymerase sigma-70 factor (ECF subfamily)
VKPEARSTPSNSTVDTAPDEHAWVARARAGDTDAFRMLVERHRDRAYALAFRMLGSAPDAEEAAQDAFLRAWRALPQFRGESAFSTWLHRIVVRRALDRRATLKSRRARETSLEDTAEVAGATESSDAALRLRLDHLLDRLSEMQRTVVLLYYYEDRSVEEVSRILEMPEGSVKTHLHRARAALREAWMEEER